MKKIVAVLLLASFSFGTFASYAADVGLEKAELVKKTMDVVAVEPAVAIEVDAPAVQPTNYMHADANAKEVFRPVSAVANAPPRNVLDNAPMEGARIRAVTRH